MTVDVTTSVTIDRPLGVVADVAADPDRAPDWYTAIDRVEWRTPPPCRTGSRLTFHARFLGRRLTYTYEVVASVPRELLVMRTAEGPFPMETTYTWAAVGPDRTRMTLRNRGEPAGLARTAAPLVAAAVRRANVADLARLRTLLEGGR